MIGNYKFSRAIRFGRGASQPAVNNTRQPPKVQPSARANYWPCKAIARNPACAARVLCWLPAEAFIVQSKAKTVAQYLKELSPDRREAITAVRKVILDNLPKGYEEIMNYGMIGYVVPHSIYPAGYHCNPSLPLPFAGLASQKNHMSVYLMIYGKNADWFRKEYEKTGKKMDLGVCCVRFKKLQDLPLDLIGRVVKRIPVSDFINMYESGVVLDRSAKSKQTRAKSKKAAPRRKPARKAG